MKRLRPLYCLILAAGIVSGPAFAQEAAAPGADGRTVFERWPSSLGLVTSTAGGTGLSYQRWFGNLGLSLSGGGLYRPDTENGQVIHYFAHARLAWMLAADRFSTWHASNVQAVVYVSHLGQRWRSVEPPGGDYTADASEWITVEGPFRWQVAGGVGVAVESVLFNHFSQTVEFSYAACWPLEADIRLAYFFRYRY